MTSFIHSRIFHIMGPAVLAGALLAPNVALAAGTPAMSTPPKTQAFHTAAAGKWITYNAQTKTAHLTLISAYGQDTFNFNGASNGKLTVKVPDSSERVRRNSRDCAGRSSRRVRFKQGSAPLGASAPSGASSALSRVLHKGQ